MDDLREPREGRDLHQVGESLRETLERLKPSTESFLPEAAVEVQRWLASFSRSHLQHLIVAAAIQLAARAPGDTTPDSYLDEALPALRRMGMSEAWLLKVKPEILRLTDGARDDASAPEDD